MDVFALNAPRRNSLKWSRTAGSANRRHPRG